MPGLFYGLEIAKTGLTVSQRQIELTGHNITNADTVGYTRQRLLTTSIEPNTLSSRFAAIATGTVGGGVDIKGIDQLRDAFLDQEYRGENADLGRLNKRMDELEYIESLFNETSDNSITSTLADFINSIHELSVDPVSKDIRTNVAQNALKLTETFNHYSTQLKDLQNSQNESMGEMVDQINDLLTGIADYNQKIYSYELGGEKAYDLRDKRNVLLDQLSGLVNINYSEDSNGYLSVSVEGTKLVDNAAVTKLEAVKNVTTGFYDINYEGTTTAFKYNSGELKALQQLRDGDTADNIGIPRIIDNLDTLARSIAKEMNAINSAGYTMPNGTTTSTNGVLFFDVPGNDYDNVTAETFDLSAAIKSSVFNIAASDAPVVLSDPLNPDANTQQGNNKKALEMVALFSRTDIADVSNFDDFLKGTVVEIGIESGSVQRLAESQQAVVDNVDSHRQSISGVSIDEEMIEMIKYQHAYQAASRMINTIDEALDTLINKTGLVGR